MSGKTKCPPQKICLPGQTMYDWLLSRQVYRLQYIYSMNVLHNSLKITIPYVPSIKVSVSFPYLRENYSYRHNVLSRVCSCFGTLFTKFESASSSGDFPIQSQWFSCYVLRNEKTESNLGNLLRKMQIQTS